MLLLFSIAIFFFSIGILHRSGEQIIKSLERITGILGVSKFTISFLVMAIAASLPNLLVGVVSALYGIPELSLGDVLGSDIIDLSIGVSIAVLFSSGKEIFIGGKTARMTVVFTIIASLFPLFLLSDGELSRGDGLSLLLLFILYVFWLFSKKDHFMTTIKTNSPVSALPKNLRLAVKDIARIGAGSIFLVVAAQGIVWSVSNIAEFANIPIMFAGIILVGLSSSLPEIYFAAISAKRGESEMIMGNLLGAVIIPSSLVLGIISIIHPITNFDINLFKLSRMFLMVIALLFLVFSRTNRSISKRESYVLFAVYGIFVLTILIMESVF